MGERIEPDELREAALLAEGYLRLDAARLYGFITGGPKISVERCEEVIAEARAMGLGYTDEEVMEISKAIAIHHAGSPEGRAAAQMAAISDRLK